MPRFTRREADALIPTVRPLLEDLRRRKQAYDRRRSDPLLREMNALVAEIRKLGIEVKDLDLGLIDFATLRGEREVYLCWRLGEGDRVSWWHEIEAGYPGRQPLDQN
jgi:hypothetical protein